MKHHAEIAKPRALLPRYVLAQVLTGVAGINYLLVAVGLLVAPHWFFNTIAPFETFNRHFMGDTGAFLLPIAIGLLFTAFQPEKYWAVFILGLWASIVHTANHLYDDIIVYRASWEHMLQDALPNSLLSLVLVLAYVLFRRMND